MVDIHCHILPAVDDGAKSWDIAIKMCQMAAADDIDHIVATPHANDEFRYDRESHANLLAQLSERIGGSPKLSLGCDFHMSFDNLKDVMDHPGRYTIDDTKYLLVELSDYSVPPAVSTNLQKLISNGLVPIITHPERNPVLRRNPARVLEWIDFGCLVQVTANSMTGRWGAEAKSCAEWLMKRGAVHVLASDAHGLGTRSPVLSEGRAAAERVIGKAGAMALVNENPRTIVSGVPLPS
jgi:protein-tyrosine phosphatase